MSEPRARAAHSKGQQNFAKERELPFFSDLHCCTIMANGGLIKCAFCSTPLAMCEIRSTRR